MRIRSQRLRSTNRSRNVSSRAEVEGDSSTLGSDEAAWNRSVNGGLFRVPTLSEEDQEYLLRRAKESAHALIDHAETLDGPMQWLDMGKHRGVQMYRGEGYSDSSQEASTVEFLCGVTTMFGTIEEVAEYFDQSTTLRMKAKKPDDVVDCCVLCPIRNGSDAEPYFRVALKYAAFEAPAALTRNRDFCYLECQDVFRHPSGRRGWVLSMHSINIPACPPLDGYVRGSMYHSGYVFVESSRPGYMDVLHSLQINFKGSNRLPQFMLQASLKRRILSVIRISREIQVARMSHQTLLKKQELMPKNRRTLCISCSRKFTLFVRKTRCRLCGEVVCQTCAPQIPWESKSEDGPKKTRICLRCCNNAATKGSNEMKDSEDSEHTNLTPVPAPSNMCQYEENSTVDGHHDDGMFAFDELEEQSSHSVFAPERFTRTTEISVVLGAPFELDEVESDDEDTASIRSSEFVWKESSKKGDPFYDVKQSFGGCTLPEEEVVHDERQRQRAALAGLAIQSTKPTGNEGDVPVSATHPSSHNSNAAYSSTDFTVAANGCSRSVRSRSLQPTSQEPRPERARLNATLLMLHDIKHSNEASPPLIEKPDANEEAAIPARDSDDAMSSERISMSSFDVSIMSESGMSSDVSIDDFGSSSIIERPTDVLFSQVRQNRSRTIQMLPEDDYRSTEVHESIEADHKKKMEELNSLAVAVTGSRVSMLKASSRETSVAEQPRSEHSDMEDEWRSSEMMREKEAEHTRRMEELQRRIQQLQAECRESMATLRMSTGIPDTIVEMDEVCELDEVEDVVVVDDTSKPLNISTEQESSALLQGMSTQPPSESMRLNLQVLPTSESISEQEHTVFTKEEPIGSECSTYAVFVEQVPQSDHSGPASTENDTLDQDNNDRSCVVVHEEEKPPPCAVSNDVVHAAEEVMSDVTVFHEVQNAKDGVPAANQDDMVPSAEEGAADAISDNVIQNPIEDSAVAKSDDVDRDINENVISTISSKLQDREDDASRATTDDVVQDPKEDIRETFSATTECVENQDASAHNSDHSSPSSKEPSVPTHREDFRPRVSVHTLYGQIRELARLQSEMAILRERDTTRDSVMIEEHRLKARIKKQYGQLRSLELKN